MGQPIEGSNPSLSATPSGTTEATRPGACTVGCYDSVAVLGGELAVPCTCNPLQQG
jgi:hypothetical protein